MKIKITEFDPFEVGVYVVAGILTLFLGFFVGMALKTKKTETFPPPDNILQVQMDSTCYEQFKNNMDKTLYLRLKFEEGGEK